MLNLTTVFMIYYLVNVFSTFFNHTTKIYLSILLINVNKALFFCIWIIVQVLGRFCSFLNILKIIIIFCRKSLV